MKYLIDSDIAVDWLLGKSQAIQMLSSLEREGLSISLMTYGEIYEGIYYSADPKASEEVFTHFLQDIDILYLNEPIMQIFARIRGELRAKGNLIPDPDL